ncbi:MAG: potassium channel family protein [Myxococcota bacterium]
MPAQSWPVVVAGLEPLGLAVLHRLHALNVPVRALVTPAELERYGRELANLNIETLVGSPNSAPDLERLDLPRCGALVLAADDAALNVDACLMMRRLSGHAPLVVRVGDPTLVRFLRMTVPHVYVYSMGSTTAPVAADLAMHLLAERRGLHPAAKRRRPAIHRLPRASVLLLSMMALLLLTLLPASLYFASALKLSLFEGFYTSWTTMVSAGHGDAHILRAHQGMRVVAMALSIVAPLLLAGTIGILADWLLTRRFAGTGLAPVRLQDHVVVMGAGNVGARVAELLHQAKVKVVVIDSNPACRNVHRLRSVGIPVVVGDAKVDDTLDLAGAWWAGVALALTDSDTVNLHIGLQMSDKKVGVPTVVRLLSPELADSLASYPDVTPLSPVAETSAEICRVIERMRSDRQNLREGGDDLPDGSRSTGRYAGREFKSSVTSIEADPAETAAPSQASEPVSARTGSSDASDESDPLRGPA